MMMQFSRWLKDKGLKDIQLAIDEDQLADVVSYHDTFDVFRDNYFKNQNRCAVQTSTNGKSGWFYTSKADWIIVFVDDNKFWGCRMSDLRNLFYDTPRPWKQEYRNSRLDVYWTISMHDVPFIRWGSVNE